MTIKKTIKRPGMVLALKKTGRSGAVLTPNDRRYGGPYYVFAKPPRKQSCWKPFWKSFWNGVVQVLGALWNCMVWVLKAIWKVIVVITAIGMVINFMRVLDDIFCGRRRE